MREVHKASSRGTGSHGWLYSKHSFSFADHFDPDRMGFGALRALNDDAIAPGKGFPEHPHQDMEIITIVTRGELLHEDDTGAKAILKPGDVQVMSAGKGIRHSERNNSNIEDLELFQLWIAPAQEGIEPRHEEMSYGLQPDKPEVLASGDEEGLRLHQDAKVTLLHATKPHEHEPKQGTYIMVIEGAATISGEKLARRDAIAISEQDRIRIEPQGEATLLIIDVPLTPT